MSALYNALERQQKFLAENQQSIREDVMKEMGKLKTKPESVQREGKSMCGEENISSECKNEPPGLQLGWGQ